MIKRIQSLQNHLEIIYIIMWAMLATAHFFLLITAYDIGLLPAFLDSLVFNGFFAFIGAGIWFMVRYSNLQRRSTAEQALGHLTSAAGAILIWLALSYLILNNALKGDVFYHGFLKNTLTVRIIEGVMIYALLVTIYYLVINYRELKEKSEREARLLALLRESELNLLRSQIRPHFLFNSLNSISALTMTDPEKAREMVIKLAEFMRYSLNFQDEKMSTLEKELYHAGLYLDIEKVRFGDRLVVDRSIGPDIREWKVPSMILQPLLENAVKYGVYESDQPVVIRLEACRDDTSLTVSLENNFEPGGQIHKGTGTGLKNITARLNHLYGRADLVKINKTEHHFKVEITIPSDATQDESPDRGR
jgi:sensor histidine kinase YesM